MNRLVLTSLAALSFVGAASAATVRISNPPPGSNHDPDAKQANGNNFGVGNTQGGRFTAKFTGLPGSGGPNTDLKNGVDFDTFCLEIGEDFSGNVDYHFSIQTFSALGGRSGLTNVPLASQTAFLFHAYRRNESILDTILAGFGGFDRTVDPDNNSLQDAIWYFQDQLGANNVNDNATVLARITAGANNENSNYSAAEVAQYQRTLALINAANNAANYGWAGGIGSVRVLHLWRQDAQGNVTDATVQDMLIIIPLPQGVGLASAGLLVLAARRRRGL